MIRLIACLLVYACLFLCSCGKARQDVSGPVLFSESPPLVIRNMIEERQRSYTVPEAQIISAEDRSHLIYYCKNQRPEVLRDAVKSLIGLEGSISVSTELNALIIAEASERIDELRSLLKNLDIARPQLLVEARLVEVNLDKDLEIEMNHLFTDTSSGRKRFVQGTSEIDLDTPGNTPLVDQGMQLNLRPWTSADGLLRLDSFFRALINKGRASILSSPNVVVASGGQTSIITGEEVPIFSSTISSGSVQVSTEFKQIGVKLRVKALQIAGDTAEIEVNPEVSAVTGFSTGPSGSTSPILAVRQMRATVRLKDGEVLSIGGLVRQEDRENIRKTPILGDIPLLGLLFRGRRNSSARTQLLFFLRIHILDSGKSGEARVHIPGRGMETLDADTLTPPVKRKHKDKTATESPGTEGDTE